MPDSNDVLAWVHFGDLHITEVCQQNHADLLALIDVVNRHLAGRVDFAVLPGDNADDGADAQFRLVRDAVRRLQMPLVILPGDHDFKTRSLGGFHGVLGAAELPAARQVAGCRCLFLDTVSAGAGGPDFRLGDQQLLWLRGELQRAWTSGERPVVFMHVYPADLQDDSAEVTRLFAEHRVACVDMGHTHYNELTNDGHTIFAATRSTGQIEEGPVGFSVGTVDRGVVNWKFQPLDAAWPLVMVTYPADHRLITDPVQIVKGPVTVHAKVWSQVPIRAVTAQLGDGPMVGLTPSSAQLALWEGLLDATAYGDGIYPLRVEAIDQTGISSVDTTAILVNHSGAYTPPRRHADGSDKDAVGVWPEKHILGTQLGPNRNGKKW